MSQILRHGARIAKRRARPPEAGPRGRAKTAVPRRRARGAGLRGTASGEQVSRVRAYRGTVMSASSGSWSLVWPAKSALMRMAFSKVTPGARAGLTSRPDRVSLSPSNT